MNENFPATGKTQGRSLVVTDITDARERLPYMVDRLTNHSYDGGLHGTCYECPFASVPLRSDGSVADWHEIDNDPTEAYFRCSLPGRDEQKVEWGEYAPCDEHEWVAVIKVDLDCALSALDAADSVPVVPRPTLWDTYSWEWLQALIGESDNLRKALADWWGRG